MEMKV